jgi:hypothetical protein
MFTKEKKPDQNNAMAGPETRRTDINYRVPLPEAGMPVYFGDPAYQARHRQGFSPAETLSAWETARRQFDSAEVGSGRVQDWSKGVPDRNRQGIFHALDSLTTSALTSNPSSGERTHDNRTEPTSPI